MFVGFYCVFLLLEEIFEEVSLWYFSAIKIRLVYFINIICV